MLDMLDTLLGAVERKMNKMLLDFVHTELTVYGKRKLTIISHFKC